MARVAFRAAFRLFPRDVRARVEAEAVEAFALGFARRLTDDDPLAAWGYVRRAVVDAAVAGWRIRREARRGERRVSTGRWSRSSALWDLGGDIRYALRRLARAPGFSVSAVVILALGVGANAAVFSAMKTAFMEPPPFAGAERLAFPSLAYVRQGGGYSNWSYPKYREFRAETEHAFEAMAAYSARSAAWTDPGRPEQVAYELVSPGYFELLGARPAVGRFFLPEEEGAAAPPGVAVLSHDAWQARFGGDPSVVGRSMTVDGQRVQVVGVAGAGFRGLTGSPAFWTPLGHARAVLGAWTMENRGSHWFHAIARLAPGLTAETARQRVEPVGRAIALAEGPLDAGTSLEVRVAPFEEVWTNETTRSSVWLLAGGAGLVLLIAVANLGSLLLARGRRDARETAVRMALGAGRIRLLRQRFLESLVLAAVAGVGGVVVAVWGVSGIRALWPDRLQSGTEADVQWIDPSTVTVDLQVVGVALMLATLAAVVFAALPTLLQDGRRLMGALKQGVGAGGRGRSGASARRWLLGGQLAFSLALLVTAGLMGGSLLRLYGEQKGFDPDGLLAVSYTFAGRPTADSNDGLLQAHRAFRSRVAGIPGVTATALGSSPPLSGHSVRTRVDEIVGARVYDEASQPVIGVHSASDDYFRTLGTPLVRGRSFTTAEFEGAGSVAVINRTAAERLFPGRDPVGERFRMGFVVDEADPGWTVVGVVEDILHSRPTEGVILEAYIPYGAWPGQTYATLLVRTGGDPTALLPGIRAAMAEVDPQVPFWRTVTGHELRRRGVADTRVLVFVLGLFAGLAVLLSAAGVWAVVAQAVAERRREIGVRVALGAQSSEVEGLMVRQGLLPLLAGATVGLVGAAVGARSFAGLLFRTSAFDPAVFGGAALLLAAVWLLASWLPARSAARVDPVEVLTAE